MDWKENPLIPPFDRSRKLARNGFICAFLDILNPRYLNDMTQT